MGQTVVKVPCRGALCARAHLSCEKLSRKNVAALGWRANNVRPYILYIAKLAFFDAPLIKMKIQ